MTDPDFNKEPLARDFVADSDTAFAPIARRLAEENARIEPPPALIDRIESRLRQNRGPFRGQTWMPGLAAAAALALAATAWIAHSGRSAEDEPGARAHPAPRIAVTLEPEAPYFAVPIATGSSDVSIVLLYRDIRPQRESPQIHTPSTRRSET